MTSRMRRFAALALSGALSAALLGGCSAGEKEPELYLEESRENIVVSLFLQGTTLVDMIEAQCEGKLQSDRGNVILYTDAAYYYAGEDLSYRELLLKRLESSQADDIFNIPAEDVLEFDRRGYLYDLSGLSCVQNLSQDALKQSTYKGKVFSIPLSYSCFGLIWNVDLLHEYGLEIPQDLGEFWSVCETLKESGILPYGANMDYGLCVPAMCVGLSQIYRSPDRNALLADLSSGETPISTYMRGGFAFLQTMMDKGYLDPEQALAAEPRFEEALFREGKCAFISSICRAAAFDPEYPFEVRMTAFPLLEDGDICVVGAGQRLAVNPNSPHLEEALEVMELLGSTELLNTVAVNLGKTSSAKGEQAADLPLAKAIFDAVAEGGQIPNQDFGIHFNIWNTVKALGVELCSGKSVDEVCQEYDRIQLEEIQAYQG